MKEEIFYIAIKNQTYRNEYGNDAYHLEKILDIRDVEVFLEEEGSVETQHFLITNDYGILAKYLVAINEDEYKMLCSVKHYNEKNIRINSNFFRNIRQETFDFYVKIKNGRIISASMNHSYESVRDGLNEYHFQNYEGWVENKEFHYFKTPIKYRKDKNSDGGIFRFKDVKEANWRTLEELINIDATQISHNSIKWDNWNNNAGLAKYYDKVSCTRFYISKENMNKLSNNPNSTALIDTKLSKDYYIEYYVTDIIEYAPESHPLFEQNYENDGLYNSSNWLSDDSGTDDSDTMNDVYWNLD